MSPPKIASEAGTVVVGKVAAIRSELAPAEASMRWHLPLLGMTATVHVLRSYSGKDGGTVAAGKDMEVHYLAVDMEHVRGGIMDGPDFPNLAVGDVYAFPLVDEKGDLIREETYGLLVPCVSDGAPVQGNLEATLWGELLRTVAHGSYADVEKAQRYLGWQTMDEDSSATKAFIDRLDQMVGDDQARWLEIAVAAYAAGNQPRSPIASLPGDQAPERFLLVTHAFQRAGREDLESRVIHEAMAHLDDDPNGAVLLVRENYPGSDLMTRLLTAALAKNDPAAICAANQMIRSKRDPLTAPAVSSAVRYLSAYSPLAAEADRLTLIDSADLIFQYGSSKDFAVLLEQLRDAQKRDLKRFADLWLACSSGKSPWLVQLCAAVIDDKRRIREPLDVDQRICDMAVLDLEVHGNVDFGMSGGRKPNGDIAQSEKGRDAAVARAKAWLARHATPVSD